MTTSTSWRPRGNSCNSFRNRRGELRNKSCSAAERQAEQPPVGQADAGVHEKQVEAQSSTASAPGRATGDPGTKQSADADPIEGGQSSGSCYPQQVECWTDIGLAERVAQAAAELQEERGRGNDRQLVAGAAKERNRPGKAERKAFHEHQETKGIFIPRKGKCQPAGGAAKNRKLRPGRAERARYHAEQAAAEEAKKRAENRSRPDGNEWAEPPWLNRRI